MFCFKAIKTVREILFTVVTFLIISLLIFEKQHCFQKLVIKLVTFFLSIQIFYQNLDTSFVLSVSTSKFYYFLLYKESICLSIEEYLIVLVLIVKELTRCKLQCWSIKQFKDFFFYQKHWSLEFFFGIFQFVFLVSVCTVSYCRTDCLVCFEKKFLCCCSFN